MLVVVRSKIRIDTHIWLENSFSLYIVSLDIPIKNFLNQSKAGQQSPPTILYVLLVEKWFSTEGTAVLLHCIERWLRPLLLLFLLLFYLYYFKICLLVIISLCKVPGLLWKIATYHSLFYWAHTVYQALFQVLRI